MLTETGMTQRQSVWTGGTYCDPSRGLILTVLDAGWSGGWLYFNGVPLTSCAPLRCDAPADPGKGTVASTLQPGRRYRDIATGLCFRCLRAAPGELRVGSTLLSSIEVTVPTSPAEICMQR